MAALPMNNHIHFLCFETCLKKKVFLEKYLSRFLSFRHISAQFLRQRFLLRSSSSNGNFWFKLGLTGFTLSSLTVLHESMDGAGWMSATWFERNFFIINKRVCVGFKDKGLAKTRSNGFEKSPPHLLIHGSFSLRFPLTTVI